MRRTLIVAAIAASVTLGCGETREAHYNSLAAAKQDGSIDRGWIPRWAPASATKISERHDLDTNEVWGVLDFSPADAASLRDALAPTGADELKGREPRHPGNEWWPAELQAPFGAGRLKAAGIDLYREKDGGFLVGVDWKTGRLYFWQPR